MQSNAGKGPRRSKGSQWSRSTETKRAVLDAAKQLFGERGYEGTSISDIVAASGVSVGSIYHQFGGKAEVFIALAQDTLSIHAAESLRASERSRAAGETRPIAVYAAGARAWLISTWEEREVTRITLGAERPPEYVAVQNEFLERSLERAGELRIGIPPLPTSTAYVLTGLVHSAALQIITVEDRRTAKRVADYFAGLILLLDSAEPPTLGESRRV